MSTIIIGAGIMGLMCARSLAKAGEPVVLCEQASEMGQQASWASGGMGMPLYPWNDPDKLSVLTKRAYELYPPLAQELCEETGIDPEWRETGLLTMEDTDSEKAQIWAQKYGFPLQLVNEGIWMPSVCQIRSPRLLKALQQSIKNIPAVQLYTKCEITGFEHKENRIVGVRTQDNYFAADRVIITTGAWSGELLKKLHLSLPIFPMRGQMLLWKAPAELLSHMIVSQARYVIPRADGHILVGSSMENVGFDHSTTLEQYQELKSFAEALLPELMHYPIVDQWAGLRPAVPNGIPFMGAIPGFENVWINAGHYRNGVLFAPVANELIMDLIKKNVPQISAECYAFY